MPVMLKPKPMTKNQRLKLLQDKIKTKKSKLRHYVSQHNRIKATVARAPSKSAKEAAKRRVSTYKRMAIELSEEIKALEAKLKAIK